MNNFNEPPAQGTRDDEDDDTKDKKSAPLPWAAITALVVIVACQCTATRIVDLPVIRLIESRYCTRYYAQHDPRVITADGTVPEELCKIDVVQQQLAWLSGCIMTLYALIDILVTFPFASISDKYGRRLVFILNTTGILFSGVTFLTIGYFNLPIELTLAAPLFNLIGGGDCVFHSVLVTTMTDITSDQVVRATLYSYVASVVYVSTVLSPLLAATIMSFNLLVPFLLAGALLTIALCSTHWLPGRGRRSRSIISREEQAPLLVGHTEPQPAPAQSTAFPKASGTVRPLLDGVLQRPKFQLLLGVVFLASFASSSSQLFVQYISKRYGWKLAQAGFLLSAKAVVNVFLLTVLVPALVRVATRRFRSRPTIINVVAAEICIAVSVMGALWIAFAARVQVLIPGLVVYALGSALPIFTELLVRAPEVAGNDTKFSTAKDFSIVMLCKTIGTLLGVPSLTILWAKGIHIGNTALGLPFYTSAFVYALASLLLWRLRTS